MLTMAKEHATPQRIWLVRHGQTAWNEQQRFCGHADIPLSSVGRTQARWLAARLQEKSVVALYSSDLKRASETAAIIGRKRQLHNDVSAAWREVNFGAWEGLTYSQVATEFPDQQGFFTDPEHIAPPSGETLANALNRMLPALHSIVQATHNGDVVLVSHGGVLRGLLCSLLHMPLSQQWQLRLDTGSLSAIDISLGEDGTLLTSLTLLNMRKM